MNHVYRIVVLLGMFAPFSLKAFMEFDFMKNPEGKAFFMVGEKHSTEGQIYKIYLKGFLDEIRGSTHKRRLPMIIEYPEGAVPKGSYLVSESVAKIRDISSDEDYRIRVIPYDPRCDESVSIHSVLGLISGELLRGISADDLCKHYSVPNLGGQTVRLKEESGSWEDFRKIIKSGRVNLTGAVGTVGSYVKALDKNLETLVALAKKHQGKAILSTIVQKEIERFTQAHTSIKGHAARVSKSMSLANFLASLFADCKTIPERITTYDEVSKIFVEDTDRLIADCLYLDKIMDLLEKEPCACIIVGVAHHKKLREYLLQLGYTQESHGSIYEYEYPLLSRFLPTPQFGANLFFATQFFMRELQKAKASEDVCRGCNKEFDTLLACARCKGVRYCGAACQKKDWPQHKGVCKEKVKTVV
jgi:hypothetical protein